MIVIKSSEEEGACYVETKNLDGETNLKIKSVPRKILSLFEGMDKSSAPVDWHATINVAKPNNLIYNLDVNFTIEREQPNKAFHIDP